MEMFSSCKPNLFHLCPSWYLLLLCGSFFHGGQVKVWAQVHSWNSDLEGAIIRCWDYFLSFLKYIYYTYQFSCSFVFDSLRPHEMQHARPPYPSPTPGVHPNSCPLSQWCHPTISSSVIPFSSCPQSFPASGSFQMSQLFAAGGQGIGVSASTSVLQWIFRTDLLVQKHQFFGTQLSL